MPRAMWKGAISFGLVTIPVSVYPATEEKTLRFNQLHDDDGGRIRMKRVCSIDGEEIGYEHIVKGYEYEKDRYVILTDEDFEAIPVESSRAIDIQQFVELEEIDPMQYKKSYYLVPEETGAKAYALLREALNRSGKVGIAKVSFRDKEHLAALRFRDEAFVLETMYWPDEIREADFGGVDVSAKVRPNELEMAQTLIDNLTADWDPAEFKDEYREAMLRIVEAKINGEEIEIVEAEPTAKVVDLMEALKASVAAAKKEPKAEPAPKKKAAKKTSAKKPAPTEEGRRGVRLPPDGYTVRPATRDDIETIARLIQTIDRHDEGIVEPVRGAHRRRLGQPVVRRRTGHAHGRRGDRRARGLRECLGDRAFDLRGGVDQRPPGTPWSRTRHVARRLGRGSVSPLPRPVPGHPRCSGPACPRPARVACSWEVWGIGTCARSGTWSVGSTGASRLAGARRRVDQTVPGRRRAVPASCPRSIVRGSFRVRADGL